MYFPCQTTKCFLIPSASIKRQKTHLKKKSTLFNYLAIYQKTWEKIQIIRKITFISAATPQKILPSKFLLVKLFGRFFPPAPPFLITNALLVLPVGYTPHLVCDHQLLNVSEELYSTDLCQWSCVWEIIVHWVCLLQSLSQDLHHSMVTACVWK